VSDIAKRVESKDDGMVHAVETGHGLVGKIDCVVSAPDLIEDVPGRPQEARKIDVHIDRARPAGNDDGDCMKAQAQGVRSRPEEALPT